MGYSCIYYTTKPPALQSIIQLLFVHYSLGFGCEKHKRFFVFEWWLCVRVVGLRAELSQVPASQRLPALGEAETLGIQRVRKMRFLC